MGRKKIKSKSLLKQIAEELKRDKGRKKEWRPRGEPIPQGHPHKPKNAYKRRKFDWKDLSEEDPNENIWG